MTPTELLDAGADTDVRIDSRDTDSRIGADGRIDLLDIDRRHATGAWRREFYLTVLIIIFTMSQAWAAMVILISHNGPTAVAVGVSLVGGLVAMINGWRYILRRNRFHVDL